MAAGPTWQLPTGRLDHLYRHLFRVSDTDYGSILRRKPSGILSVLIFSGQKLVPEYIIYATSHSCLHFLRAMDIIGYL